LLSDCQAPNRQPEPTARRWTIYHVPPAATQRVAATTPDPPRLATGPVFYGAKGLALLRGGTGRQRYGAQLFFGPGHNHSQRESMTWTFFARGAEWSYAPGYFNKHYRASWITQTVSHQALVVNQRVPRELVEVLMALVILFAISARPLLERAARRWA